MSVYLLSQKQQKIPNLQAQSRRQRSGIPPRFIPSAFGQILYGSKYKLKQARGTFGLGGKMAVLYGQITTHQPVSVTSSTGQEKIYIFKLMIDIQRNKPIIVDRKVW